MDSTFKVESIWNFVILAIFIAVISKDLAVSEGVRNLIIDNHTLVFNPGKDYLFD